jgi:hypothetical protein
MVGAVYHTLAFLLMILIVLLLLLEGVGGGLGS